VIGNQSYASNPEVPHAETSASAVAARLVRLGFQVEAAFNTSKSDLELALDNFNSMLSAGCTAIVYYCGRGWQEAASADCLLVPVDFCATNPGEPPPPPSLSCCLCSMLGW
jgi:hypothetical protein